MSTIEDKLRDAYQQAAQTVQPQAIRPEARLAETSPRARRRKMAMLAPLAAAAAVVIVTAGAVTVPHLLRGNPDKPAASAAAGPSSWIPAPNLIAGTPPFLLALRPKLQVVSATSGKLIATVPVPVPHYMWTSVAAVGTSNTFVLAANNLTESCSHSRAVFYALTLSASGKPAALTPLSIPPASPGFSEAGFDSETDLTVSADSSTVAFVSQPCDASYNTHSTDRIVVVRDGFVREWTEPWVLDPTGLTLSSDGSILGFVNLTESSPASAGGSAWMLPLGSAPGVATQRGQRVFADGPAADAQAQSEVLSAGASTMYIQMLIRGSGQGQYSQDQLDAYSTRSGKLIRILHTWDHIDSIPPIITAGGNEALIWQMENSYVVKVNLNTAATARFPQIPEGNPSSSIPLVGLAW
jgi:hypothetical protein